MILASKVSSRPGLLQGNPSRWWHVCLVLEGGFEDLSSETDARCDAGVVRLSGPGSTHVARIGGPTECRVIQMDGPFWLRVFSRCDLVRPGRYVFGQVSDEARAALAADTRAGWSLEAMLLAMEALAGGDGPAWLDDVKADIDGTEGDIDLGLLGRRLGIARPAFAETFRRRFGLLPSEYRALPRMQAAANRLSRPDAALADVAADCGYADQSHMSNAFRTVLGRSPRAIQRLAA